jgi:signal peptidase I
LAIWPVLSLAALAPFALIFLLTGAHRPIQVSTDTMAPAIEAGDVIVNEIVPASDIRAGDVVVYSDRLRDGAVIVERVVTVTEDQGTYSFETSGHTSSRVERWSMAEGDRVGRVEYRVPGLARWIGLLTSGFAGLTLPAGLLVGLGWGFGRRLSA